MKKNVFQRAFFVSALAVCLIAQANISMAYDQSGTGPWNGTNFNIVSYSFSDPSIYATITGSNNLRLTNAIDQAAAAWAVTPVSTTSSFTTTFSFYLQNPQILYYPTSGPPFVLPMADGIALAFQKDGNAVLGTGGASLGAFGTGFATSLPGITNVVGSAVQTWSNNRLGLFQGDPSNLTIKAAPFDLGAAASVTGTETVSYDATTGILSMTGNVNGNLVSDSLAINLNTLYGPTMYVGFTGGSGLGGSVQDITAWNGINATVPEPAILLLLGFGLAGLAGVRRTFKK